MQDRYTGDIGDFGKLGLLRVLGAAGLSVGVNWYLTPDESHNTDGCHTSYLYDEACCACDGSLRDRLRQIVERNQRRVDALQSKDILPAEFFSMPLDFRGLAKQDRREHRTGWHGDALSCLDGCDIVFADPDNGLVVPSAAGRPKENKYVLPEELADYYAAGSSVIYYQHKARRQDVFYAAQHEQLLRCGLFEGAEGAGLKFRTTSQRYYFFIIQPRHRGIITGQLNQMLGTPWNRHFSLL